CFFFFQAEDGIRDRTVTGVQTCALPICMGTTCTAACVVAGKLYFAHVGDSRLYLMRSGSISRLTRDHSYVNRLIETGLIRAEEEIGRAACRERVGRAGGGAE